MATKRKACPHFEENDESGRTSDEDDNILEMIHPFSSYPNVPKEYFDRKKLDLKNVKSVIDELSLLFTSKAAVFHLPHPVVGICAEYAASTFQSIIRDVLDECRAFKEGGGFDGIMKANSPLLISVFNKTGNRGIRIFARKLERKVEKYDFWFRVRRLVPSFLRVGPSVFPKYFKNKDRLSVPCSSNTKRGFYLQQRSEHSYLIVRGGGYLEITLDRFSWLMTAGIPYIEIVGPILNTKECTMEIIDKCIKERDAKDKEEEEENRIYYSEHHDGKQIEEEEEYEPFKPDRKRSLKWLTRKMIIFAITREAINDSDKLIHNFEKQKRALQIEWNKFQAIYKFGDPFEIEPE